LCHSLEHDYAPLPPCFDLFGNPALLPEVRVVIHDEPTLDLTLNSDLFKLED